jgi:hypothetical protein
MLCPFAQFGSDEAAASPFQNPRFAAGVSSRVVLFALPAVLESSQVSNRPSAHSVIIPQQDLDVVLTTIPDPLTVLLPTPIPRSPSMFSLNPVASYPTHLYTIIHGCQYFHPTRMRNVTLVEIEAVRPRTSSVEEE